MCIFKLLPLMCFVTTALAIRVPLCHPRIGQGVDPAENNEICLCTTGSSTIINRIDAEHFGIERLVIFVYRKPNTGEIISFIPERDYQRRIPDFPEDYGNIEDISYNPSILDIFDNSPSKDIRENTDTNKPAPAPQPNHPNVVDLEPKDLDIVNGHHQGQPEKDITIPHWQIPVTHPSEVDGTEFPEWQRPDMKPSDAEDIEFPNWQRPDNKPSNVEDIEFPNWQRPDNKPSNVEDIESPNWQKPDNQPSHVEPADIIPHEPGTNEYETIDSPTDNNDPFVYSPEDRPIYVTPEHGNEPYPYDVNPDSEMPVINHNSAYPYDSPVHPVQNTEYDPESNRDVEHGSSESNPTIHPQNPEDNPPVPYYDSVADNQGPSNIVPGKRVKNPLKDKYGRIIGWPQKQTHVSNSNWGKGRHMPPLIDYNPSSYYGGDGQGGVSFDNWLKQQLKSTTLHGNRIPTSTSDIVALHTAIRNLLLQNGLVVTKHGTLTDGYGKVSSLTNLKLRPIFIGKSFSYNSFMQSRGAKFKIPTDTPFLEGLLLTMIKPAKILGIVPLKITSLADEVSPEHKHKKHNIHGHESHTGGQKASFKVLPIEDLVAFRKGYKKRRPRPHVTKIPKSNKYRDSALLQQALSDMSKPGKIGHVRDKSLEEFEKSIVSEEKPDFRIIGGASATSSGTPLLFKGRSGFISSSFSS